MKTPYFLISETKLKNNINDFQNALNKLWSNSSLAYSVKTNSLPWLLKYLNKCKVKAEVVSDEEYMLAKLCGYEDSNIVFNGPVKGEDAIKSALKNKAYVNIDSDSDLLIIEENQVDGAFIGIRVNVDTGLFDQRDIGYQKDGFRFGFSEKNDRLAEVLNKVTEHTTDIKLGLHLHCNSITRSLEVYKAIAEYAAYLINKYKLDLSFIDMGGGFFGGIEGKPSAEQYISCIKEGLGNAVDTDKTELIIEPGSAIIGSAVDLYTTVTDVKETTRARIVTTDGSRIHIDPLWAKEKYMYSVKASQERASLPEQIVCGYTCMDHDRIMKLENEQEVKPGDKIVYHRVGAYSMTLGGMFIRYLPEVYVEQDNKVIKVRNRISVEDYYNINS